MQNWIVWNWTVFDIETVLTLNWIIMYNCLNKLNGLKWKCFWQLNCVLMQNWIVLNRIDYLHKNGFGVNQQRLTCHKTQPTKLIKFENSITTINPQSQCLGLERKNYFVTTYLETKSFIWLWFITETRNSKKRLHVLEADIITS